MAMDTRRAKIEDAAKACAVLRRSITELCYLDHGGDKKLLAGWLSNKTIENVGRWILESYLFVAEEAGEIVGVAAMDHAGKITLNYVSPDARFRGVSKSLLVCMENTARALGIEGCSVESTQTALRFYQDIGFRISERSYVFLTGQQFPVLTKRFGSLPICESGDHGGEAIRMTETEKILAIIGSAIDLARRNPKPGEPIPADDYVAWVIVNELRRAGFKIVVKDE
jgi:GNAT superfamily N-acetyltransferase